MPFGLGLGAAFKIGSAIFGGGAKKRAAKAEAQAFEFNALQVEDRARIDTTLREREGQREIGAIQTGAGASGLAGGGSAADILRESTRNTLFDLASIKTQSSLEAKRFRSGAAAARTGAKLGLAASVLDLGSSLLGGRS